MATKVVSLDAATFDQWQSVGLVEGLSGDLDIAKFLIHKYDSTKEPTGSELLCQRCQSPLPLLCDSCRLRPSASGIGHIHLGISQSKAPDSPTQWGVSQSMTYQSQPASSQSDVRDCRLRCETLINQSQLREVQTQPSNSQPEPASSDLTLKGEVSAMTSDPLPQLSPAAQGTCRLTFPLKKEEGSCDLDPRERSQDPRLGESESPLDGQQSPTSASLAGGVRQTRSMSSCQRKRWGGAERKALGWFLARYQLHTCRDWADCATVLNAALATSHTGEECRRRAIEDNLLAPKTKGRQRASTSPGPQSGSDTAAAASAGAVRDDDDDSGDGIGDNCGKVAEEGRPLQRKRRTGLRSSRSVSAQVVPKTDINNDDSNITTAEPPSHSVDTEEKKDIVTEEDPAPPLVSQTDDECHTPHTDVSAAQVGAGGDGSTVSAEREESESSTVTWHYLGVADVDLPDGGQKRKSFRHSPADRYQCKECSSSFTHRGILVKHIRLAHLKWRPHLCDLCPAAYATRTKLQRHVNVAHAKVRPYCCETCGASFVDQYTLTCHKQTHEEGRQYRFFCELCGKGYYGMRELKRHMETHAARPTKSLLCWVCGKAVRTTQYLRIHLRTHSPDKAFTCPLCGHVFTSKCALEKHRASQACQRRQEKRLSPPDEERRKKRVVTLTRKRQERKVGTYPCDICHKYFSQKKNIYKHKRSVHGVEAKRDSDSRIVVTDPAEIARYLTPKKRDVSSLKYSCDLCAKRYSSQESLRKHKNIVHYGRRDYKCDLCDKTFTRHTSVIEHKHNVHNLTGKNDRPKAQCDICHKTFAAKNSLRKHLKTVHFGLLPYSCTSCGKKFASKYHLREHHKTSGHSDPNADIVVDSGQQTDTFAHSLPQVVGKVPEGVAMVTTSPVAGLGAQCMVDMAPVTPWTAVPSSSGSVTPAHNGPGVRMVGQELSAPDCGVGLRALPSVSVWNLG